MFIFVLSLSELAIFLFTFAFTLSEKIFWRYAYGLFVDETLMNSTSLSHFSRCLSHHPLPLLVQFITFNKKQHFLWAVISTSPLSFTCLLFQTKQSHHSFCIFLLNFFTSILLRHSGQKHYYLHINNWCIVGIRLYLWQKIDLELLIAIHAVDKNGDFHPKNQGAIAQILTPKKLACLFFHAQIYGYRSNSKKEISKFILNDRH